MLYIRTPCEPCASSVCNHHPSQLFTSSNHIYLEISFTHRPLLNPHRQTHTISFHLSIVETQFTVIKPAWTSRIRPPKSTCLWNISPFGHGGVCGIEVWGLIRVAQSHSLASMRRQHAVLAWCLSKPLPALKLSLQSRPYPSRIMGGIKWWCQQEWGELSGEMALGVEEGSVYVLWEGEGCNVCQSRLVLLVFLICDGC